MFKKIVVGMDGSARADHAFEVASDLAKASNAGITIAHVDEKTIDKGVGPRPVHADEPERIAALEEKAARLTQAGTEADVQVASLLLGTAGARIASIATEVGADLIVVGTHGHGGVAGTLLGSVAHRLLSIAHVPVLVVPDPAREPVKPEAEGSAAAAG